MTHQRPTSRTALLCLAFVAWAGASFLVRDGAWGLMVNSKHDFTTRGFSGGGVCAECHVPHGAREVRLFPRDVGEAGVIDGTLTLLCKDCHKDSAPSLPTGPGWSTVTGVPAPPANPHAADARYSVCTACHPHTPSGATSEPFGVPPNDDCLSCHKAGGLSSIDIDQYFDGIGDANSTILSQHNIYYNTDGNYATYEPFWPAVGDANAYANECKKCHGDKAEDGVALKHPTATVRLDTGARAGKLRSVYLAVSDATGKVILPAYAKNDSDKRPYEPFCLACHQGKAQASTPTSEKFSGAIPSGQVAPTLRSNPANQQPYTAPNPTTEAGGWIVPAVPPKDGQLASPFLSLPPYFQYYETNGHGAPSSLIRKKADSSFQVMDRTCLSRGTINLDGCHVPHGSKSRFLLDDDLSEGIFAPGLQTATQVATGVCLAGDCHVVGVNLALWTYSSQVGTFHGWWNQMLPLADFSVLHDNSLFQGVGLGSVTPPAADGMSQWRSFGKANMNIFGSPALVGVLPFWSGTNAAIEARTYPLALTNQWVSCLTCHDVHGSGPSTEPAMLRLFDDVLNYDTPLCGQCHSEP